MASEQDKLDAAHRAAAELNVPNLENANALNAQS